MKIGVLALQGAFIEHERHLKSLPQAIETRLVRTEQDVEGLDGLILPGGESTAMSVLAHSELWTCIRRRIEAGMCVWGTCAGLILLADKVEGRIEGQAVIGGLPIHVKRNYFGSQQHSFITPLRIEGMDQPFKAVFIRAPAITSILDTQRVRVLARLDDGLIVAVQQGTQWLGTAFHPELTADSRFHQYFVDMILSHQKA